MERNGETERIRSYIKRVCCYVNKFRFNKLTRCVSVRIKYITCMSSPNKHTHTHISYCNYNYLFIIKFNIVYPDIFTVHIHKEMKMMETCSMHRKYYPNKKVIFLVICHLGYGESVIIQRTSIYATIYIF